MTLTKSNGGIVLIIHSTPGINMAANPLRAVWCWIRWRRKDHARHGAQNAKRRVLIQLKQHEYEASHSMTSVGLSQSKLPWSLIAPQALSLWANNVQEWVPVDKVIIAGAKKINEFLIIATCPNCTSRERLSLLSLFYWKVVDVHRIR